VLVVALDLAVAADEAVETVLAELLRERGVNLLPETSVEVLRPFVPGHRVILLLVSAREELGEVEGRLDAIWKKLIAQTTDGELTEIRRRVAAATAAHWSGATGRARRAAAVAAGTVRWRTATDLEMSVLSVSPEAVNPLLQFFADWREIDNTGAGVVPIVMDTGGR
jgi:hypothetical protein